MEYIKEHTMQVLDLLNKNAGALNVLFAMVAAVSMAFYVILICSLVKETKKLREAQTEPKISIILQISRVGIHCIDLVIKNIGLGPAYNVKFEVLEEFDVRGD